MAVRNPSVTIINGTVDNSPVGATTPSTGTFTTLIGGGGSANYGQLTGGATTKAVEFKTLGSDTNVGLAIRSQGTGAIDLAAGSSGVNISNGGTVTAITRTNSGGPNYTTVPSVTVSAPTTAGGVQATASATMFVGSATVSAGGSGYLVGDVLTISGGTSTTTATLTVATLSGSAVATVTISNIGQYTILPSNPVSVTGGTGTNATFTLAWSVSTIVVGNAGSGYVEQPTITFSSGSATAYATVGSAGAIKFLGASSTIQNATGNALVFQEGGTASPVAVVIKNAASAQMYSSVTNSNFLVSSNGTGYVSFQTSTLSLEQMRVSHTASAVNYVQVTGNATTGTPIISGQGSDTNVNLGFVSKGSGEIRFASNSSGSNINFRVLHTTSSAVNYGTVTGAAAGSAPNFAVAGSDTDIDLSLSPKGAGAVRFGTYTVSALLSVAGYITIKDSGGTSRRLLVG